MSIPNIQIILAIVQLYLIFQVWRCLRSLAAESERKKELEEMIRKFAKMFAEASEGPAKKKAVNFEAKDE